MGKYLLLCVFFAGWCVFLQNLGLPSVVASDLQAEENLFGRLMRSILWVALSASPSILLLATNNQMSSSGPAVPFMWILPLATYLLTFVICFDNDRWYSQKIGILLAVVSAILATVLLLRGPLFGLSTQLAGYCIVLFGMSYFCHGELSGAGI